MQAFLLYKDGDQTMRVACKEVMIIGREEGNDIVLRDARVSRRHAMLYRMQDGSFYLVDEGSANGSYVNAVRISLPARLNDGDQISIGSMNMQFRQPGTKSGARPPRDERAAAHDGGRDDTHAFAAEALRVVSGVLQRHLVVEPRVAGIDRHVVEQAE